MSGVIFMNFERRTFLHHDNDPRFPFFPKTVGRSTREGICGQSPDSQPADHEQAPGVLLDDRFVDAGGHVKIRQIRPAERAGGRFQTRQFDAPQLLARLWIEANDAGAVTKRDP